MSVRRCKTLRIYPSAAAEARAPKNTEMAAMHTTSKSAVDNENRFSEVIYGRATAGSLVSVLLYQFMAPKGQEKKDKE